MVLVDALSESRDLRDSLCIYDISENHNIDDDSRGTICGYQNRYSGHRDLEGALNITAKYISWLRWLRQNSKVVLERRYSRILGFAIIDISTTESLSEDQFCIIPWRNIWSAERVPLDSRISYNTFCSRKKRPKDDVFRGSLGIQGCPKNEFRKPCITIDKHDHHPKSCDGNCGSWVTLRASDDVYVERDTHKIPIESWQVRGSAGVT